MLLLTIGIHHSTGPPPPTLTDKDKDVGSENLDLATFKRNEHNGKYQTHGLILIICSGTQ